MKFCTEVAWLSHGMSEKTAHPQTPYWLHPSISAGNKESMWNTKLNCLKWSNRKSLSDVNQCVSSSGSWQPYKYIISLHFNQSTLFLFYSLFCMNDCLPFRNWRIISMWRGKWQDLTNPQHSKWEVLWK